MYNFVIPANISLQFSPVGFLDVFNSDGNTLGQNFSSYSFIHNYADGMLGYVEYTTCLAMV